MIQVSVAKENNVIDSVCIKGHSGYGHVGNDIVCASVSSIVITTVNALIRLEKEVDCKEADGFVSIKLLNHDPVMDMLLANMLDLLEELEEQYKDYIKINKEVSSC